MEKRTLVALGLSFLVIGLYPTLLKTLYPAKYETAQPFSPQAVSAPAPASSSPAAADAPAGRPSPIAAQILSSGTAVYRPEEDFPYETDTLKLLFHPAGGTLRQAAFRKFRDADTGGVLRLFSLSTADNAPFSVVVNTREISSADAVPDYRIETPAGVILMQGELAAGALRVTKEFALSADAYHGTVKVRFENRSNGPLDFDYHLFAGESFPPRNSIDGQYLEANFYSVTDERVNLQHVKENRKGRTVQSASPLQWIAVKDRQFSLILAPKSGVLFTGLVAGLGDHRFRTSLGSPSLSLAPGASVEHEFLFYIGPNDVRELMPLGLDPIVNFGKLDMIARLLVGSLEALNKVLHNYGLAIITLTALINLILFPLTRASYMSMKRMQLVQPQMNKLREQHKKNPEKLNREMMELYKKHKVNPFGGCLPMLLQMPVFMALYVALSKSSALLNSKFLWVRDLSSPDKVQLPFTLPFLGDQIHVLPLIMVGAMVIQQRFTQIKMEGQDPAMEAQQRMMAVMMPLLFGFIFYTMPSGLVLYWLTNTILMSLYQLRLKNMKLA